MTRTPVVFIPGFPASELVADTGEVIFPPSLGTLASKKKKQRFIDTVTDLGKLRAGEPIREVFFGIEKQAQSLYDTLRQYGYSLADPSEFRAIGWDWRRAVDDAIVQSDIRNALQQMSSGGRNVLVIAHSTGGLVLRQLLSSLPALAPKVGRILALGVPWAGTLKAFRYLLKGESTGIPSMKLKAYESAYMVRHAQAAYDLLPPPRNLAAADVPPAFVWENGVAASPMVATSWIPGTWQDRMAPMATAATRLKRTPDFPAGIPITNVAGFGAETDTRADIVSGKTTFTATPDGDGTVPYASATWLRGSEAKRLSLPVGIYPAGGLPIRHSQIWDAPPMLDIFDELLMGAPPNAFIAAALDSDDASMGGQHPMKVRIAGAGANGAPLIPMSVTFSGLRVPVQATVNGHGTVTIPVSSLPPATNSRFVRFTAIVTWAGGGRREVPLMYRR
jgi:hypothetical protein